MNNNDNKEYNLSFKIFLFLYIIITLSIWSSFVAFIFLSFLGLMFYALTCFFMWGWEFLLSILEENDSFIAELVNSSSFFSIENIYLIISFLIGFTIVRSIIPDLNKIKFYIFNPWEKFIKDFKTVY